jgi:hypothetical protein
MLQSALSMIAGSTALSPPARSQDESRLFALGAVSPEINARTINEKEFPSCR